MTLSYSFGATNVLGSINTFFQTYITAAGLPTGLTGVSTLFDFPDRGLTAFPCFTVVPLQQRESRIAQGGVLDPSGSGRWTGTRQDGFIDVSCWASTRIGTTGGRNPSAIWQLRSMRDMVTNLFQSARLGIQITDIYSSLTAPPQLTALIRFGELTESMTRIDANPSVRAISITVPYSYLERR